MPRRLPSAALLCCAVLLTVLSSASATASNSADGFVSSPTVVPDNLRSLTIRGLTTVPGTVKCLVLSAGTAGILGLVQNATVVAFLPASIFWSDQVSDLFPGSFALNVTVNDTRGGFSLQTASLDLGSLALVSCAFDNHSIVNPTTTQGSPVFTSPAVSLVGTPDTQCAKALNPVTQSSFLDYPWAKMKQFSTHDLGVNDLGQYANCLGQRNTTYCSVGVAALHARALGGYCLPDVCNSSNIGLAKASAAKQAIATQLSTVLSSLDPMKDLDAGASLSSTPMEDLTAQLKAEITLATYAPDGVFLCAGEYPQIPNEIWYWGAPLLLLVAIILVATFVHIAIEGRDAGSGSQAVEAGKEAHELREVLSVTGSPTADWIAQQLSLLTSWCSLVEQRPGNLQFFDGIRFLAASWVVLGHVEVEALFPATGGAAGPVLFPHNNGGDAETKTWWWQLIPGGFFAVDTSFFIGGFFTLFVMLRKAAKVRSIGVFGSAMPMLWFGRWLRLVPSVLVAMGAYWLLLPSLGSGPAWPYTEPINESCNKNWWRELLFITSWNDAEWGTCIGVTWYLTCDFFYYAVSPFIVMLHMWSRKAAVALCVALLAASVIANTVYAHDHDMRSSAFVNMAFAPRQAAWSHAYFKPWMRAAPYLVGMLYAIWYNFVTQRSKQTEIPHKLLWWHSLLVQIAGGGILMYCIFFIQYEAKSVDCSLLSGSQEQPFDPANCNQLGTDSQWTADIYNGFSRALFGAGLALLAEGWIWGGDYNFGRWVLSLPIMAPLGKLSFNAYLWHYLIKDWYYGEMRNAVSYTRLSQLVAWLGIVYISFAVALIAYVFVEEPMAKLATALLQYLERVLQKLTKPKRCVDEARGSAAAVPDLEEQLNPAAYEEQGEQHSVEDARGGLMHGDLRDGVEDREIRKSAECLFKDSNGAIGATIDGT